MLVLIVTKTTNYELHGAVIEAKVEQGRVPPDALARLKTAHTEHYDTLLRLRAALARAGIGFDEVSREFPRPWSKAYDLVMTVGGDGTLLAASHQMAGGGLIAGVRSSLSSVGYLCCAGPADVEALVGAVAAGRWVAASVQRLRAEVIRSDGQPPIETEPVLNDFLYANANPAATTRYRLTVADASEVHRSSGIWVATATGSTAAIFAAGGAKRPYTDASFQYRVRELYRLGHSEPQLAGACFEPEREPLEIENRNESAILALDGQHGTLELGYGDRIRFLRANPIELVRGIRAGS